MDNKQKIAFVTDIYVDNDFSSGGVKLNFLLLKSLFNKGYEIDLYTNNNKNITTSIFKNTDIKKNFNKTEYRITLSDKAVIKSDITYIHDHSYPYRIKMMSNNFKHFFYKIFNNKKHKKRLNEFYKVKDNICNTKIVIVSSEVLKNDVIENYGVNEKNVVVLPPPVELYTPKEKEKHNSTIFGISAVGFDRKGGYEVLKAIKILKKEKKNFKVKFIYPSNNFGVNLLVKLYNIEKYCEFLPLQKDMSEFYNSIDCLLMPSKIEPFGMVATEALSCGVPVITGKHCGASDCIIDGKNGFLYDRKNKNQLFQLMKKFIDNKYDMSEDCINSVKQYSLDNFVKKYIDLIESLKV